MQAPSDSRPAESRKQVTREEVKLLAISVGVREAARQLGLNENTVRQWSSRYEWFKQPDQPKSVQQRNGVTIVTTTPADLLQAQLKEDSESTKIDLSTGIREAARHVSTEMPVELFKKAKNVKELVVAASQLHGWEQQRQSSNLDINVLAGGRAMIQVVQSKEDTPAAQP